MPKKKVTRKVKSKKAKVKKSVIKRKPTKKKPVTRKKKPVLKKAKAAPKKKENVIGKVTHYFPHVRAAVIKLKAPLTVGDKVKIKGHTTDFQQLITSMQIDRVSIQSAKKGQEIGMLVDSRVRQHDVVCKI